MSRNGKAPAGGWLDGDQRRAWLAYIRVQLRLAYEMNRQLLAAPGALDQTMPLLADGRLRLRAHKTMPMQEAAQAHRQLETGTVHERIILTLR